MRAAMGRAGLKKVTGRTWPVLCDELIGHYEQILGSTGTAERQHDDDFRGTR
jgi:hypothetical protein